MPVCFDILPDRFEDMRQEAIRDGLRRAGFQVRRWQGRARPGDFIVSWTRSHHRGQMVKDAERQGARAIICEESPFRRLNGQDWVSLFLDDASGAGRWYVGDASRWRGLGLELAPWRTDGRHVIVTEQRGIGSDTMASPPGWHEQTADRLRALTKRPVVVREHPKKKSPRPPQVPSADDALRNAWCVVTWSSAFACESLLRGVPVIYQAPHIIVERACERRLDYIEHPAMPDRLPAFCAMAWSIWRHEEIRSGEPFALLLHIAKEAQRA